MPIGAGIGAAVGGIAAMGGSMYAADKQSDAAGNALAAQQSMFNSTQQNYKPFIETGKGAMYSLAQLYGISTPDGAGGQAYNDNALEAFRKAPDYDWRMKEGMRALDFSASAKGLLGSRGHLNNTVQFGQGLASQGLGDYTSRLISLAKIGADSANAAGGQSSTQGNILGNTMMAQGQAQASGVVGATNAFNSTVGNIGNNLALYNAINGSKSAYGSGNSITVGGNFGNDSYWNMAA